MTSYEIIMHILGFVIGWAITSSYYIRREERHLRRIKFLEKSKQNLLDEYKQSLSEKTDLQATISDLKRGRK